MSPGQTCHVALSAGESWWLTFNGMVVNHVQEHLDASSMELAHELLELVRSSRWPCTIGCESRHGRKEAGMRIAPDVHHVIPGVGDSLELQLIKLKDGQKFHSCDAQLLQMCNLQPDQCP